jgi:hypothetical protein
MGHIVPTQAGGYRANWRDAAGRQRAKTFPTKREAKAYLAEVETAATRGLYVDPPRRPDAVWCLRGPVAHCEK